MHLRYLTGAGPGPLQLLTGENETLLVRRDTLLILDLCLHIIDRVAGFDIQRDRFASKRLYEDLHASSEAQHKVQCRFLLDVVIRKCAAILQLLASENETPM